MLLIALFLLSSSLLWFWSFKETCTVCKKIGLTLLGAAYFFLLWKTFLSFIHGTGNIFFLISLLILTLFYFLCWKFRRQNVVAFSPLISTLAFLFTLVGFKFGTFFRSDILIYIHIVLIILALSLLLLSSVASLMRFLAEKELKSGQIELPLNIPLHFWSKIETKFFFFGFIFLTVDLIFNIFLIQRVEGKFYIDSRIVGTFLLWFYYGLIFHLKRFGIKPIGNRFYIFNALGGVLILFLLFFTKHNF